MSSSPTVKDFSAIDTLKRDSRKRAASRASCPVSFTR